MELSSSNIKRNSWIFSKNRFSFKEKIFLYFLKRKLFTPRKFPMLRETEDPKKLLIVSQKRIYIYLYYNLYFWKRKPRNGNSKKLFIF